MTKAAKIFKNKPDDPWAKAFIGSHVETVVAAEEQSVSKCF